MIFTHISKVMFDSATKHQYVFFNHNNNKYNIIFKIRGHHELRIFSEGARPA